MLYIVRLILTVIYCILVCIFGSIYCLFSPRNPKHVATFGHMFGRLAPLFGLKVEKRLPEKEPAVDPVFRPVVLAHR